LIKSNNIHKEQRIPFTFTIFYEETPIEELVWKNPAFKWRTYLWAYYRDTECVCYHFKLIIMRMLLARSQVSWPGGRISINR